MRNVFCRYGIPQKIISYNGLQFDSEEFANWCQEYGITKIFSAIAYPQTNGQVKAVNKVLKTLIKKKLEKSKGAWIDELPTALWAYHTLYKTTTGHTMGLQHYRRASYSTIGLKQCCWSRLLHHLIERFTTISKRMRCSSTSHWT